MILTSKLFQYKNGTEAILRAEDKKLVDTVCTGICATGGSTESVIEATCKELESGPEWVDEKEEVLTATMVNTTWEEQCQTCDNFPDKADRFSWNCTLKVTRIIAKVCSVTVLHSTSRLTLGSPNCLFVCLSPVVTHHAQMTL